MATTIIPVLLLEDDESQAFLTKEVLEKEGFSIEICRTGQEGLSQLLVSDYQAYLIDMTLPDLRGCEVLRRITMLKPAAVTVIMVNSAEEMSAVEAMRLGASDYIVKSSCMGHLATLPLVIREAMQHRHLRDERQQLQAQLWEHARLLEERNAELRRANEELKRLNRLKSDLVAAVSHELRSPLATIKEFTAILLDGLAGPINSHQQDYLDILRGNIDRMARIIDDLLDMTELEYGHVVLKKRAVDVCSLVERVVASMKPLGEGKQLHVDLELPEHPLAVFADSDKVTQVLTQLVSNAIDFTPGPGRIVVGVKELTEDLQLFVSDTGVGIGKDVLPKLFQGFQRSSVDVVERSVGSGASARSNNGGRRGAGLGLAISKRLVELHGGQIWVESQVGSGSTFFFTLPKFHLGEVVKEYLRTGMVQAKQKRCRLSVIMATLVEFEQLKGRDGGEELGRCLKGLEQQVLDAIRRSAGDIVVHYEHGTMMVILMGVDKGGCAAVEARIKRIMEDHCSTVLRPGQRVSIGTSSCTYPDDAVNEDELLRVAEQRLPRHGKSTGSG